MRRFQVVFLLAVCVLCTSYAASAHHSLTGQFDMAKPMTLVGTISKIEWINPHVYIYLDVKDRDGQVSTWSLETYPPAYLRRAGLTRAIIGVGQQVTARVLLARAESAEHLAFVDQLTFADGRQLTLRGGDR